jgi:hypothetical protein
MKSGYRLPRFLCVPFGLGAAFALAACGGGGGSSPSPAVHASTPTPAPTPSVAPANAGIVSVYISFPGQPGPQSVARASAGAPKPQWTSPASGQNATVFVDSVAVPTITHVTTAGSYSVTVSPGSHVFTVTYYDSTNAALTSGSSTVTIASGSTTPVPITMQGIVSSVQISTSALTLGTSVSNQTVTVAGLDHAGKTIAGTYLYPITLSVSQPNFMSGILSLTSGGGPNSSVSVTASGQSITLTYNGSTATGVSGSSLSGSTTTGASGSSSLFGGSVTMSPTIAAGFGRNILSWTAPTGGPYTYNVYRGKFPGQETTQVATGLSATSYYDYAVLNSFTYYYRVSAVNTSLVESFDPTEVSSRPSGDPSQLATMVLWIDPSDPSTVTSSAGKVSQVSDKSGAGNNATQSSAAAQPTLVSASGRQALQVTSGVWMSFPAIALTGAFSLVGVGKDTSSGTFDMISSSNAAKLGYFGPYFAANFLLVLDDTGGGIAPTQANPGTFFIMDSIRTGTGANQTSTWFNGSVPTSGTGTVANTFTLSSINYRAAYFQYGTGFISEVMAYSASLPTAQRQTLEGYLACKWGLQSSLPTSHPYYSATANPASCP